ncbi:hypothetical protein D9M69_654560 [compost metagenome]
MLARSNTFCSVPTACASRSGSQTQTARFGPDEGVKVFPLMLDTISGMSYHCGAERLKRLTKSTARLSKGAS